MRYYDLIIKNAQGQVLVATEAGLVPSEQAQPLRIGTRLGARQPRSASANPSTTFSSQVQGPNGLVNNPGALDVEFDIPTFAYDAFQGNSHIRIYGVPLQVIGQASNLNINELTGRPTASFTLWGGMMKGLPLANLMVGQAGILAQGQIFQAYGTWQGTTQCLDLVLLPGDLPSPRGMTVHWLPQKPLGPAIAAALAAGFPNLPKSVVNISSVLLQTDASKPLVCKYDSLKQLADYVRDVSLRLGKKILGDKYLGVSITIRGNTIYVTDSTTPPRTVTLGFEALIGQPTWLDSNTVSFKTVLRADLAVGDKMKFPTGFISPFAITSVSAAQPNTPARSMSAFQGSFIVTEAHHYGHLRQPDGDSWCTAFTAVAIPDDIPTLAGGFDTSGLA